MLLNYFKNNVKNIIYVCEFLASLLQPSMSHEPPEIRLIYLFVALGIYLQLKRIIITIIENSLMCPLI